MISKQDIAFPQVAIINKGTPKKKIKKGDKEIEVMGADLNQKMRVHFLPGTENARAAFHQTHASELVKYPESFLIREGYEVLKLRAIIPATNVWDAWDYANEAYQSGRRVALADDDHYLILRDPLNGNNFLVKDGKPYRKFTPGETIDYVRDGKPYSLPMKTHGRLRLVLEDMVNAGLLVQVILKTTSFYDCQNIQRQLAGIQAIADSVNNGNAGGVPFEIYRSEQEVTWNKKDGSAARVKKWFYNIQADPEWVKSAFARLSKSALTGEVLARALLPEPLKGPVDPEAEELDDEQPDGFIPPEADEVYDVEPGPEQPAEPQPAPAPKKATGPQFSGEAVKFNTEKIVAVFAAEWGKDFSETVKELYRLHEAGQIPEKMTVAQARDYALGAKN